MAPPTETPALTSNSKTTNLRALRIKNAKKWVASIEGAFAGTSNPRTTFPVFRVPESWKKLQKDLFDPDFLSLGLFYRLHENHTKQAPTQFKIELVKGFIEYVNKHTSTKEDLRKLEWEVLRESVVPDPLDMQDHYDLDHNQRTDDPGVISSVLALDSVFLFAYLRAHLLEKSGPKTRYAEIVDQRTLSFHQKLVNDIVKLENQVPLVLIERVVNIMDGQIPSSGGSEAKQEIDHEENGNVASSASGRIEKNAGKNQAVGNSSFKCDEIGRVADITDGQTASIEGSEAKQDIDREENGNVASSVSGKIKKNAGKNQAVGNSSFKCDDTGRVADITDGQTASIEASVAKQDIDREENGNVASSSSRKNDKNEAVGKCDFICRSWVELHKDSLPGFDRMGPEFLKEIEWFRDCNKDCKHLLQCLCRAMHSRNETTPEKYRRKLDCCANVWAFLRKLFKVLNRSLQMGCRRKFHRERANSHRHSDEISLPAASKLWERGIHFRCMKNDSGNLVPKLKRGRLLSLRAVLYIPSFSVLQNTELVWRNMLAYILYCNGSAGDELDDELENKSTTMSTLRTSKEVDDMFGAHAKKDSTKKANVMLDEPKDAPTDDFVCFMMFMDEMIDTEKDVALLRDGKNRVIRESSLGSNKVVANLFNTMGRQQALSSTYYERHWQLLREEIDQYQSEEGRVMALQFLRYFFGKTWLLPSVVAALLFLSMAVVQTVYTVLAYY